MKNEYRVDGDTVVLFVKTKGTTFQALIDTSDLSLVMQHSGTWRALMPKGSSTPYVVSHKRRAKNDYTMIQLHSYLMNPGNGMFIDHINHNGLDNRRANLRVCTPAENNQNLSLSSKSVSGYRGVVFEPSRNKWKAYLQLNGRHYNLGRYNTKEEANEAVVKGRQRLMTHSVESI